MNKEIKMTDELDAELSKISYNTCFDSYIDLKDVNFASIVKTEAHDLGKIEEMGSTPSGGSSL
jgi:hypothetical protein